MHRQPSAARILTTQLQAARHLRRRPPPDDSPDKDCYCHGAEPYGRSEDPGARPTLSV